ncbi:MAG: DUF4157 domain-containing protein [Chloroflexi bacterium]|nr:DUF4157 domain-containing protein [Chloroflexota bacterium]
MSDYQPADAERALHRQHSEAAAAAPRKEPAHHAHPLVALQARAGNQAVARMVQRAAEEEELQMKHDPSIQREGEEEEELQMKHDPSIQREGEEEEELQMKHDPSIQREGEEEELQMKHDSSIQREGEEEEELQMKHDATPRVGLEGGPVGQDIASQIDSQRGSGSGLASGFRSQMEGAFGADFGDVRIHQGAQADTLNRQLTAKAFTTGNDIFLRSDASTGDSHLMAHELTHVVQQRSGGAPSGGGMTAGPANDPQEHEADRVASEVLSGGVQRELEQEARA